MVCDACRNADISNTFKLDLHALHVDEAIEEIEKTRQDLSRFHCRLLCLGTWHILQMFVINALPATV